jgi:AcrR family transcriptional regulator
MPIDNKEGWIKAGYEIFALSGAGAIKIEPLAKRVGKSKSSFYHHFADLELFTGLLLKYHVAQSRIIAEKEQKADNIDPALIHILIEHRIDLLFNRQLRINQNNKLFSETLHESNKLVGNDFIKLWVKDLDLKLTMSQIEGIFTLALENFYLQINADNLNYTWLSDYFANLKQITRSIV